MKKFFTFILLSIMTLNISLAAFANEIHTLSERPPISSEIEPYGTKPPDYNSVHDLLKSNYNYNVESMGAALYTDKRFKNVSNIYVDVNDFSHIGGASTLPANYKTKLIITLYNSSKKEVGSKSITFTVSKDTYGDVSFINLDTDEEYYIKFSVPDSGNKWAFYGTVSGEWFIKFFIITLW